MRTYCYFEPFTEAGALPRSLSNLAPPPIPQSHITLSPLGLSPLSREDDFSHLTTNIRDLPGNLPRSEIFRVHNLYAQGALSGLGALQSTKFFLCLPGAIVQPRK